MGLALNPQLKFVLIRDGSLLDDDGLAIVVAMATEFDAQVFIELARIEADASIIIKDGRVSPATEQGNLL